MSYTADIRKAAAEVTAAMRSAMTQASAGEVVDPENLVVMRGSVETLAALIGAAAGTQVELGAVNACQWERNAGMTRSSLHRCRLCNRPVSGKPKYWIHESGTGDDIWRADLAESETENDSYGQQPIGSECARTLPPSFDYIEETQ